MAHERSELDKSSSLDLAPAALAEVPHRDPRLGGSYYADEGKIHLRELWRTVRKHKWLVITTVLIITSLATLMMYRARSIYQASTMVEIGKESNTLVKSGDIILQNDDFDPFYLLNIKTKLLFLQSRSLLEDVVVHLKLDQNPKFLNLPPERLQAQSQSVAPPPADATATRPDGEAMRSREEVARLRPYVRMVEGGMSVEQVPETRAISISYTHTDPEIAALVANGIAQEFLDRNFQSKLNKFTRTSNWLDKSTRDLKAKVEHAEQALTDYTREHNIFATEEKETLTTNELRVLHEQVMRAEADRMLKESLYEEVTQGRVAQLPEAFADMIYKSSPKLVSLQKELGELMTTAAQLSVKYGPENPRVVEIKQQINAIQEQLDASRRALEGKLKADYERAVRDEQALKAAFDRSKAAAVKENQASIKYNILKQEFDTSKALYTEFLQKTNQANIQVHEQYNNLRLIDAAEVPTDPVGPRRVRTILIALFLSLMAGIGMAFFIEYLDNTVKTVEDVSRYAQVPTLAMIPAIGGASRLSLAKRNGHRGELVAGQGNLSGLAALDAHSSAAEAYRGLRTAVLLSSAGSPPKTILITSSQPSEGKTTTIVNTGISLAQLGASVLIVDCDLRKPTAHRMLGLNSSHGLTTYLSHDADLDGLIQPTPVPNLSLLPCGPIPPNPAELISSEKMRELLRTLTARYDHILIDSPPLMNVTDPAILSTMVDGVILVVHGGKSTRDVVRRARQELSSVGAKVFGVVLNNLNLKREGYDDYYYYRYYSNYGQEKKEVGN